MGDPIDWNHIVNLGAAVPAHFGNPQREFDAARTGAAVVPATPFELLRIHGGDARAFLQGQLTCDLDQVTTHQAQFGGYCTPQGRLLANFVLMAVAQGYLMYLPADVASAISGRLRKFIMCSDVKMEPETRLHALGLTGPAAPGLSQRALGIPPQGRLAIASHLHGLAVRLPGENFLLIGAPDAMPALWAALAQDAVAAGADCWNWAQIQAGLPWITAATQDQFLPQMIGLDAIGGVSFDKGCYAGQEIVARTHYRGEVKRKLRPARTAGIARAGDALLAGGQQCGTVLNAAPVPGAGSVLLAVVSEQSAMDTVRTASGESVDFMVPAVPA